MASDRDTLFLKVAVKNKMLSPEEAEQALSAQEKRREIGVDRTIAEIVTEKALLTEAQVGTIQGALRASLPPEQIGGFKILEKLGKGAVGTVYKAHQISLDKTVAVKVLHQSLSKHPEFVQQFIHEARAVGRINHPHVVHAIDAGQADGYNYFAMEYVDGETLRARLKKQGRLPETQVLEIARAVVQGLANAHESGLLHRDLKPDNILLGKTGTIKIGDLGLALPLEDAEVLAEEHRRMGSPFYMSPEQAQGKEIDERSDLYCLGATLYHAVVGKPPFTGSAVKEILKKHVHQDVIAPTQAGAEITEGTEKLILRLLAKDPAARCQSARATLSMIDAAEEGMKAPPPQVGRRAPTSRKPTARRGATSPTSSPAGSPGPPGARGHRTRASRETATAPPPPPSRVYAVRQKYIFAKIGGGVGALLGLLFVVVGLNKNSGPETTPEGRARAMAAELTAEDERKIQQRIKDWNGQIKDDENQVRESIDTILTNADNDPDRLRGLYNLLNQYATSYAVLQVVDRIETIRKNVRTEEVSGAEAAFAQAATIREEGRLWDAVLYLDKLKKDILKSHELEQQRDRIIGEIEDEIDEVYKVDIAKVKELRAQKEYRRALEILDKVATYADTETLKDAEQFRAEVEEQQKTYVAAEAKKRTAEETQKYARFMRNYKDLATKRDFLACISRCLELRGEMATEPVLKQLDVDLEAFQILDKFFKGALAELEKKIATKDTVTIELMDGDKRTGSVARVTAKTIYIRLKAGGGSADFPLDVAKVTDQTFFNLMESFLGKKSPDYLIPLGVLFTYRGQFDIARQHLALAEAGGIATDQWNEKLDWLRDNK